MLYVAKLSLTLRSSAKQNNGIRQCEKEFLICVKCENIATLAASLSSAMMLESDLQTSAGAMEPVRRGYAATTTGQVHYRRAAPSKATAAPILCLHMSPASGFVFESLLGRLGTDRDALALDTPGFGASDPLPPYPEIADYARVLLDAVRVLGLDTPIDLLGYHTGASIACEMARQQPATVGRIILISAPVFTAADLAALQPYYREEQLFTADGDRLRAKWLWFQEFLGVGTRNTLDYAARIFIERLSGKERHWWGHRAAFRYDLASTLQALERPPTILNIADDLTLITRRAAAALPSHFLIELPELTHGFLDSHTDQVATLLRQLLP
jgi:pimeloyl-ACP methyl ester carboxylesterase